MNPTSNPTMLDYLIIIQARLGSTRLPNKVMRMVGGRTILRRVWDAAKQVETVFPLCNTTSKIIVAWPERYPDLDESNVLERFRRISKEFPSKNIIRLTADCPLLTARDIGHALTEFQSCLFPYYCNGRDGHDVQIFAKWILDGHTMTHREHVIADFNTKPTGLSVNTKEDLERVRGLC